MCKLPIGIQNFEDIRTENYLYIDKTKQILNLIENGKCYFLSRPRRFGKSLTISTLEAMFQGKAELFKGLYAEEWVKEKAKNPSGVIKLDMSLLGFYENKKDLNRSIINYLVRYYIKEYELDIVVQDNPGDVFLDVINELYKKFGHVVLLIDEYDKPITDNINNLEKANEMRETLRSFYGVLKGCSQVKFIMITGVSKFSKAGVFSCLNNLKDISMSKEYSDIVGYTQKELEDNFVDWFGKIEKELSMNRKELIAKIKKYYDGFSFDGIVRVYNPFSVLNFFADSNFGNYWYDSATPSFLAKYLKKYGVNDPKAYINKEVSVDFTNSREIEIASVESFLYQAGYLTIKKREDKLITLDYPNEEVKSSMAGLYLEYMYNIESYASIGNRIWKALKVGNIENVVELFNKALITVPYEDFSENTEKNGEVRGEYWYRSLFIMLLTATGLVSYPEVHISDGRPDVVIPFEDKIVIIEFKFAKTSRGVSSQRKKGVEQVKKYALAYEGTGKQIITSVFIADDAKKQVKM